MQEQTVPPGGRGHEASSVVHHVLGQRQRGRGQSDPGFPDLLLHQSPSVLQAPAGQQCQRCGRHLLNRTRTGPVPDRYCPPSPGALVHEDMRADTKRFNPLVST